MATISELLTTIETAIYGKDLRTALAEAIKILNEELTNISETTGNDTSSNTTPYTLPIASANTLGGIKIGKDLSVSNDGTLNISPEFSDSDIGKFLHVNLNKEIDQVQLTGGMFALGDTGLELSLSGKIELSKIVYNQLLNTNDALDMSLDDITGTANKYASIITLSETCNAELYEKLERKASLGFLSTFSFTEGNTDTEKNTVYLMQIVFPIISDNNTTPIVTRSKIGNAEWGEWSTLVSDSENTSGTDIKTVDLGIESDVSLDNLITEKNLYSGITLISEDQNSELYNLYSEDVPIAFISTRNFKTTDSEDPGSYAIYSRQTAYPFSNPELDLIYPTASRIGVYTHNDGNSVWSDWQLDNSKSESDTESGGGSTAETVDITSDFGTWNIEISDEGITGRSIQVVRTGNIINGTITIFGKPDDAFFNIILGKKIFTINEKYRPVIDAYMASVVASDVSSRSIINSYGAITSGNGALSLALNGQSSDYGNISTNISFTYACKS